MIKNDFMMDFDLLPLNLYSPTEQLTFRACTFFHSIHLIKRIIVQDFFLF